MSAADRLWLAARALLPDDVGCAVEPIGTGALLTSEAMQVARAVPRRQAEFATGRLALRRAIAASGFALAEDRPILSRPDRRPDLPAGLVVSLAHAGDLCIALASTREGRSLGVDIEPVDAPRPEGLAEAVRPYRFRRAQADALPVFCAKEALFKRQFSRTGRMLEFDEVAVVMAADGAFAGCVAGVGLMRGRWQIAAGFCLALSLGSETSASPLSKRFAYLRSRFPDTQ